MGVLGMKARQMVLFRVNPLTLQKNARSLGVVLK